MKRAVNMDVKEFISDLDTKRFGFRVAKVNSFDSKPQELLSLLRASKVKLVISQVSAEDIELINTLESLGFLIKDIQVTHKYDLTGSVNDDYSLPVKFVIRDAMDSDVSLMKEIALKSFRNYGHYFQDKKLNPDRCYEIYGDWIARSYADPAVADRILVAEVDSEIAGFLSFKIFKEEGRKYAAGGLGAVAEKFRNRDVFGRIVIEGLNWGKELGLDWVEHNTLITNYPVNRSLSKLGFKTYKSFITMHHWIEEE